MYNSTGCEHILQNGKFISVIFIYYFNFAIFKYIFIVLIKKKEKEQTKNPSKNTQTKNMGGETQRSGLLTRLPH